MKKMISPSMMCAPVDQVQPCLRCFGESDIEYVHLDIMDGIFVPNYSLGIEYCRWIKAQTAIPLDLHLMIMDPEDKLDWFPFEEGDLVSVHWESSRHVYKALQRIRQSGGKAFLALNPGTPVHFIESVLEVMDGLLIMTVNPGFAGQTLLPAMVKKVEEARRYLDLHGCEELPIQVDGNISFQHAKTLSSAGASIFVAGSSSVFTNAIAMEDAIQQLRAAVS